MTNRDTSGNYDQRFVNIYPETRKVEAIESTKIYMNKRPGTTLHRNIGGSGVGRGIIYFNNKFYVARGNTVWEDGVTPVSKITMTTSTGKVGMVVANSATIGDYLFVCDGIGGWFIKADGTVTAISDVNFPTPHAPTPMFIDGYILLPKNSDIYNCTLDTPSTWPTTDYVSAEMFPDKIKSMARQNNQVMAFGDTSVEFFYDAANASGSPLSRNDAATLQYGIAAPYAVMQAEKTVMFIAQSESGGRFVVQVDGFQPKRVSDEFVDKYLNAETNITAANAYGVRTKGHMFYVVHLVGIGKTLVYDVDEKLWHEWSYNNGGTHSIFPYQYMADPGGGTGYLLHTTSGDIVQLTDTVYQDNGTAILVDIVTNKYDMDTINRKFMSNFRVVGDSYGAGNTIDLRWSDDDYQSWSNTKTIALSDSFPNFARLGSFRRRAFNLKHALNYPLRIESVEVTFTEGGH